MKGGNCCIWQRRTTVILQSDLFLRGSSTRYRAHFLKNFLPLSYGQRLKNARFITIYRWYVLSCFLKNKPPFMADAIAINLFASPLPRQWCKKYHGRYGILSDCPWFLQQQTSFSRFLKNKTPSLKFWKKKLLLSALPYPSSLLR